MRWGARVGPGWCLTDDCTLPGLLCLIRPEPFPLTHERSGPRARAAAGGRGAVDSVSRERQNAVFALHGRKFRDDKLNKYFYGPKGFVPGQWPYDVLKPNPRYEDALLTKGQWKAIELFERLPEK